MSNSRVGHSEFSRKARRVVGAWSSLVGQAVLLPIMPTEVRLRRLLLAGELTQCRLPLVRLETIVGTQISDSDRVSLPSVSQHEHNCSIFELVALAVLAKWMRPRTALEIGTFDGRSALAIAANAPTEATLFTLNLPPDYNDGKAAANVRYDEQLASKVESGHRWKGHPESARIRQLFGNSLTFDFTPYSPSQFIFIDGGHSREIVASDTHRALSIVDRRSGVILWHDATRYGVKTELERRRAAGESIFLIDGTSLAIMRFVDGDPVKFGY
jgi:predicted O-methyltransferase YrrM